MCGWLVKGSGPIIPMFGPLPVPSQANPAVESAYLEQDGRMLLADALTDPLTAVYTMRAAGLLDDLLRIATSPLAATIHVVGASSEAEGVRSKLFMETALMLMRSSTAAPRPAKSTDKRSKSAKARSARASAQREMALEITFIGEEIWQPPGQEQRRRDLMPGECHRCYFRGTYEQFRETPACTPPHCIIAFYPGIYVQYYYSWKHTILHAIAHDIPFVLTTGHGEDTLCTREFLTLFNVTLLIDRPNPFVSPLVTQVTVGGNDVKARNMHVFVFRGGRPPPPAELDGAMERLAVIQAERRENA